MKLQEVIARRISIRTYQSKPTRIDELEAVKCAGEKAEALTPVDMRFHLCSDAQIGKDIKGIIGDYGRTIHAPYYIVLASREGKGYLTDAGYRFEQMVLEATKRRLGTCCVGLMFNESELRSTLKLDDSWRVIVLSPIGQPLEESIINRMMRTLAASTVRRPINQLFFWQRHGTPLPAEIQTNEHLRLIFDATRWAPSWRNKQPWRFVLTEKEILIYKFKQLDREGKDYHRLDCGIAMSHLHFTATELGLKGRWELGMFDVPGAPNAEPIGRYVLETAIL